jgi:Fur family ferric uptake transcriptional regulator
VDAPVAVMPHVEKLLDGKTDFIITGHRIEFLGICPKCQLEVEAED